MSPKPMRSPDDLPVTCADCGGRLRWVADRFAFVHTERPADDHAPRPVRAVLVRGAA